MVAKRRGALIRDERAGPALAALPDAAETAPDATNAAAWIRTFLDEARCGARRGLDVGAPVAEGAGDGASTRG